MRRGPAPLLFATIGSLLALSCGGIAAAGSPAAKSVGYGGVTVRVPADWPVIDLAGAPHTCIRYDRPAVYLGRPAVDQDCPAHAVGRTEAVLIQPAPGTQDPPDQDAPDRDAPDPPDADGTPTRADAGARVRATAPPPDQTLSRRLGGLQVSVSYGEDAASAAAILGTARLASARQDRGTTPEAGTAPHDGAAPDTASAAAPSTDTAQPTTAAPPVERARTAGPVSTRKLEPVQTFAGTGFDTCGAPGIGTMATWAVKSPYKAAGIYIGGSDRACPDGNLTPDWVRKADAQGWNLFPIYVGRQAPCWTDPGGGHPALIQHNARWSQGVQAADDAANRAAYFGLSPASAIYFDMEYYPRHVAGCTDDVRAFLAAWTSELHRRGYLSGVYSSASGAIADLTEVYDSQAAYRPDIAWYAHWDNKTSLFGDPTLGDRFWPGHRRIKQYTGGHNETFGGVRVNLDADVLDAPVAGVN